MNKSYTSQPVSNIKLTLIMSSSSRSARQIQIDLIQTMQKQLNAMMVEAYNIPETTREKLEKKLKEAKYAYSLSETEHGEAACNERIARITQQLSELKD